MHDKLLSLILPVTQRLRAVRRWQLAALVAMVAALIGIAMLRYTESSYWSGYELAASLLIGTIILFIVVAVIARVSFRNPRQVASQIERRFPSLDQRLLTALSQTDADGRKLGYLQQRVVAEARNHSRSHRWIDVVPPGKLLLSRLAGVAATALLLVVLGLLVLSDPAKGNRAQTVASSTKSVWKVVVEPGDTEVERGSSLVITARFIGVDADAVPSEADLICTAADGTERRITMKRNLTDPVVGGFLAAVDEDFTYQVVGSDWISESFSVDVFEYPSLVRSDADLDYPDYTGLTDKRVEDTVRVSAVQGTLVKWICFVNKPITLGELVTKEGERMVLHSDPDIPGALSAEIDLQKTQRFAVRLTDDDGRENKYPPELVARMLANQPPKLKLAVARDMVVSPLEELPIAAEVQDDFGIAEVGLTYVFADQPSQDVNLGESIARGEKKQIDHVIELEELGAEPDQLLSYHIWADDFGPDGKLRRTHSDLYFAEVRPFEEIYREGEPPPGGQSPPSDQAAQASQNAEQTLELAELQKEIINATWTVLRREQGDQPSDAFAGDALLLMESQAEAMEKLAELEEEIADPKSKQLVDSVHTHMQTAMAELAAAEADHRSDPLAPALSAAQAAYGALLKLRAREFEVVQSQPSQQQRQQSSSSSSAQQRQQQLDELELTQDENRYETQQQAQETPAQQQQREVRQILNRLRDLARRQEDLNKELAQLQSALEEADTQEEQEEIERQLKRLRDQQQDLLRETDELSERMQQPENQESMQEASDQLEQTRENVRQAAEALQQDDAAEALTSGKRAEREFEEMRDEFRQRAASEFNDSVREMRREAQELDQQQEQLAEQLKEIEQDGQPGLRNEDTREQILETLESQEQRLGELLDQMQKTVEEAENAEPLLAQKLYDSYRKTKQRQIEERLQNTSELFDRGFDPQAREFEREASEGIDKLREDLEQAAESVLGNETEALQRALGELEQLSNRLDEEIDRSDPGRRDQRGTQQNSQPGDEESQPQEGQPSEEPTEQPPQPSPPGRGQGGGLSQYAGNRPGGSPITGDGYQDWSDRLRDVEEMVEDSELRSQAARIRDRAREARIDFRRHSKDPQWSSIEEMIAQPLRELKRNVAEELLRRSAEKHAPVLIDRDPVPAEFTEPLRKYYESLGSGR